MTKLLEQELSIGADRGQILHMQTNYLGPFALTRMLEPELLAGAPSRVVNVSSIMHRSARLKSADSYLHDFKTGGSYGASKLANVLFAYEHHRRLAWHGVQVRSLLLEYCLDSCACILLLVLL